MTEFLVQSYVRSLVFGLIGIAFAVAVSRKSASIQHMVVVSTILAILAIPVLRIAVPEQPLAWLPPMSLGTHLGIVVKPQMVGRLSMPADRVVEASAARTFNPWIVLWLIGVAAVLGRYLHGLVTIVTWAKRGRPVTLDANGVGLLVSDSVGVPMTAWLGRHVILVPSSWETWMADRRDTAVQHEMAHVRRNDWLTQLGIQVSCALFWPNPIVWILCRRARALAERAADDVVLASGVSPTRYAQDLLEIARETKATFPDLSVCMAKGVDVARRIELVLRERTQRGAVSAFGIAISAMVMVTLATPIACMALTHQQIPGSLQSGTVPSASAKTALVQYRIECQILTPGVSLTGSGVLPKSANAKGRASSGSNNVSSVMEVSDKMAKELVTKWKKQGHIQSSPVILTLSSMKATINCEDATHSQKISVTPTYRSADATDIAMEVEDQYKSVELDKPVVNTRTVSTVFRMHAGSNVVFTRSIRDGHEAELLGMLHVSVIDSDKP